MRCCATLAYESVLKRLRRVYHGLVADWLIAQTGERIGEYSGLIADHLEGAGRQGYRSPRASSRSAASLTPTQEAVNRYERALALLEEKPAYEEAARISTKLGLTHQMGSTTNGSRQAFDKAFVLWRKAEEQVSTTSIPAAPYAFGSPETNR